jgi:hypothetical protein
MDYFLSAPLNGVLLNADAVVEPGNTINMLIPSSPLPSRPFWASPTALGALSPGAWPCRLFVVQGDPVSKGKRHESRQFTSLQVIKELDVMEELDKTSTISLSTKFMSFLDAFSALRVDSVRLVQGAEDEYYEANPNADVEKSPIGDAYKRARKILKKYGREHLLDRIYYWSEKDIQKLCDNFFDIMNRKPHDEMKLSLKNAVYAAVTAILASDELTDQDYKILTEDWRRITGETL